MIRYLKGDATNPIVDEGTRVICHVCNDIGKWGAGFSGALSNRWKDPEKHYRSQWRFAKQNVKLGEVQWVFVDVNLAVVNMIAQHKISRDLLNYRPLQYDKLEICLDKIAEGSQALMAEGGKDPQRVTIHMPRIGCGLAGGTWDVVEGLVEETLWDFDVYVYDLEDKK